MKRMSSREATVKWWKDNYGIANGIVNGVEQDYLIHKDNLDDYTPQANDRIIFETSVKQPNVATSIKKVTRTPETSHVDDKNKTTPPRDGGEEANAPTPSRSSPKTTQLYDDSTDEEF